MAARAAAPTLVRFTQRGRPVSAPCTRARSRSVLRAEAERWCLPDIRSIGLLRIGVRLSSTRVNCLIDVFCFSGSDASVCLAPPSTIKQQNRILCLSAVDSISRQRSFFEKWKYWLQSLWRLLQVSALLGPPVAAFPFMLLLKRILPGLRRRWWDWALWSIEALGPCMVKFMQWASTRRDILPPEVCDILEPIQGHTKAHSWKKSQRALETVREDWDKVLTISNPRDTLGSGSVAQVYRGTTVLLDPEDPTDPPLAREVAVKIIHPDVKRQVEVDLELLRSAAWLIEWSGHFQWWSIKDFVEEFAGIMSMQLDLRKEARALDRFRENFKTAKDIHFPQPLWPLTNELVMVEDFVDGIPISNILREGLCVAMNSQDPKYPTSEKKRLAKAGLDAFLKMVFLDNFVHSDLHPGNIFVTENILDKNRPHLTFIDAGIVTELTDNDRRNFVDLFYAIATGNGDEAGRLMIGRARDHQCRDPKGFSQGIDKIVKEATGSHLQLGKIRVGLLLQKVLGLCLYYRVKLESNFASILLGIGVLEGVGRSLDPNLDILAAAAPVIVKSHFVGGKAKAEVVSQRPTEIGAELVGAKD